MKPEQERDQWSAPEYVEVESIVVEQARLPIDEGVVKDLMTTIDRGDVSALPPVHLWRKLPSSNPTLVAGRNRLEAHKRSGRKAIAARVITGETPEIIRTVQLIELDENLNRRELSRARRLFLTRHRKAIYEEQFPETKRGSAGGRAKAGKSAKSQNATKQTPAFIDAHAKQTGRHRATIAREISEAETIGSAVIDKIAGTSLDKQSEITALATMNEHERQAIVDRAFAGEKVSAAKLFRASNARGSQKESDCDYPEAPDLELGRGDSLKVKDEKIPLPAQDPDGAVPSDYTRWLSQYEAVKAKQAALAQEQHDVCCRYNDLRLRIEEIDREARRVNEAKPSVGDDCPLLGNTESFARAAGLSIMTDLELSTSAGEAGTLPPPSEPFAVQVVRSMNLAALAPAINPEQVAARNAAAIRRDTELINRYVADQIEIARRRRAFGY
jgi:ParB family chromosome partitioning protein